MNNFKGKFNPCFCKVKMCTCGAGLHSYIDSFSKILDITSPKYVLEWGPGANTMMCLNRGITVHSKEYDTKWVLKDMMKYGDRYSTQLVHFNTKEWIDIPTPIKWDLYFVDSRERSRCLESIYFNCTEQSIICLHDAQRNRYHEKLSLFPYVYFHHRGFCSATKSLSIYNMLKSIDTST